MRLQQFAKNTNVRFSTDVFGQRAEPAGEKARFLNFVRTCGSEKWYFCRILYIGRGLSI